MHYRKKPVIIEAIHWQPQNTLKGVHGSMGEPCPPWMAEAVAKNPGSKGSVVRECDTLLIYTLEGVMRAEPGDWVIRGVKGELYPCKPDIFEQTYDGPIEMEKEPKC